MIKKNKAYGREPKLAFIKSAVSETRSPKNFPVKFVAIDGHGGSGKTSLANFLGQELGAQVIHQDDFASWDNPLDWWPRVLKQVLEPIKQGAKTVSYERGKWWPDHRPKPIVDQPVTPIMILEGVSSSRKEFRPYLTYKIWVETPVEICLTRGIERDKAQGTEEEIKTKWQKWLKDEDAYIARDNPVENANLIVDGTVDIYG